MPDPKFRVNWTIPVPIIATLVIQTSGFVYWAASWKADLTTRVNTLESWVSQNNQLLERTTRVEEKVGALKEQSTRIEQKLDSALERKR